MPAQTAGPLHRMHLSRLSYSMMSCAAPPPPPPPPAAPTKRADGRVIATPYAKKLAKDMGIDLANIGGSGPNGRITASDVEAAKNGGEPTLQPPKPSGTKPLQLGQRTSCDAYLACCTLSPLCDVYSNDTQQLLRLPLSFSTYIIISLRSTLHAESYVLLRPVTPKEDQKC